MMLASSLPAPESEDSKALNIQYPKAIDGDAIVLLGPADEHQTWVKYGGRWDLTSGDDRFPVKRIIADLTGVFSFSTGGGTTATSVDAGKLALIGLLGYLLLRGAIK
jgi:hypothetical protein